MPTSLFIAAKCNYIEKNLKTMKNIIFCVYVGRTFLAIFRLSPRLVTFILGLPSKKGISGSYYALRFDAHRKELPLLRSGLASVAVHKCTSKQPAADRQRRMGENNISCASASTKVRDTHPNAPMYFGDTFRGGASVRTECFLPTSRSYNFQSK